jgi:hypothetical protein
MNIAADGIATAAYLPDDVSVVVDVQNLMARRGQLADHISRVDDRQSISTIRSRSKRTKRARPWLPHRPCVGAGESGLRYRTRTGTHSGTMCWTGRWTTPARPAGRLAGALAGDNRPYEMWVADSKPHWHRSSAVIPPCRAHSGAFDVGAATRGLLLVSTVEHVVHQGAPSKGEPQ